MDAIVTPPKPFAWSYSRLKAFEDCPRRYHETQIKKTYQEEQSEQLSYGDQVHKAIAVALRDKTLLPPTHQIYQKWVSKIDQANGDLLVECQFACTRELKPTPWFAEDVWLRVIVDAAKLDPPNCWVIDWKTGKSANGDPVQLVLTGLVVFQHFPEVREVTADFVWLQENRQTTQVINRKDALKHWAEIVPRIKRLRSAHEADVFPPMPGRFCRAWCPVSSCEYHGR